MEFGKLMSCVRVYTMLLAPTRVGQEGSILVRLGNRLVASHSYDTLLRSTPGPLLGFGKSSLLVAKEGSGLGIERARGVTEQHRYIVRNRRARVRWFIVIASRRSQRHIKGLIRKAGRGCAIDLSRSLFYSRFDNSRIDVRVIASWSSGRSILYILAWSVTKYMHEDLKQTNLISCGT